MMMKQDVTGIVTPPRWKRNFCVDALTVLFGISSWIGVTSTYLQLPLLVSAAPEGWDLPSYMVVTVQSANIGSFAYVLYQKYSPKKINDGILIYCTLVIGCIASICMAFFYQHTVEINGSQHSVALMIFIFLLALVGCLSSVLFMPYMGRFRECYLVSYMLGMVLNGFLSSILALIQGVGGPPECKPDGYGGFSEQYSPPNFGTKFFFAIVFAIMVLSTIAFILLNNLSTCKKEYVAGTIGAGNEYHYDYEENIKEHNEQVPDDVLSLSTFNYVFLMGAVAVSSGLGNGFFYGVMTFICLPYGNGTYHLATIIIAIANACAGLVAMFVPHTSIRVIRILSLVGSVLAVYILSIALQSPEPFFKGTTHGEVLIITSLTVFYWIVNYMKISIVSIFRYQEGRSLVWVGTVNQIASAIGAITCFILVNYTQIFKETKKC